MKGKISGKFDQKENNFGASILDEAEFRNKNIKLGQDQFILADAVIHK